MMYTSYFSKINQLEACNITPIVICSAEQVPEQYSDLLTYPPLTPSYDMFIDYKNSGDEESYIDRYCLEVLGQLDFARVAESLVKLAGSQDIALIGYKTPDKFCHRHLVSQWLSRHGVLCIEFE